MWKTEKRKTSSTYSLTDGQRQAKNVIYKAWHRKIFPVSPVHKHKVRPLILSLIHQTIQPTKRPSIHPSIQLLTHPFIYHSSDIKPSIAPSHSCSCHPSFKIEEGDFVSKTSLPTYPCMSSVVSLNVQSRGGQSWDPTVLRIFFQCWMFFVLFQ